MRKVLEWGVFVVVCLGVFLVAGPTSLGGGTSYVIVDGTSMEPTYRSGDLVVARERVAYEVGDVITYDAPVGRTYRVIHRITDVTDDGYLTQGDNRDELDGWVVPFEAVHGGSALVVPHGGTAALWLRHPPVLIALVAGWLTFTLLTRRESRRDRITDGVPSDDDAAAPVAVPGERVGHLANAALMTSMAVVGLTAGVLVANAAGLVVTGGTIQVFESADRPPPVEEPPPPVEEPAPPAEAVIAIEWRSFNNGGNPTTSHVPSATVTVAVGEDYEVASQDGVHGGQTYAEVPCTSVNVGTPAGDWFGSGTFTAADSGRHLVCLQHRPGGKP